MASKFRFSRVENLQVFWVDQLKIFRASRGLFFVVFTSVSSANTKEKRPLLAGNSKLCNTGS